MCLDEWRVGGSSHAEGSVEGISVEKNRRRGGRLGEGALSVMVMKREEEERCEIVWEALKSKANNL